MTKTKKTTSKKKKNTDYTHIMAILDRSGSMNIVKMDAIGGFNEFLKEQKKLKDKATMSVVLFDDQYTPLYDNKEIPINDVEELTTNTFVPRGSTALYDAIGKTINSYTEKFNKLNKEERPDKVLVIIVTDGAENASREYNNTAIKSLIEEKKKNDWQFLFLCSTEDALNRATSMGVSNGNVFKFSNTSSGNKELYNKVSSATALYRGMSKFDVNFDSASSSLLSDDENK